ncbi:efflux RND transporter periplasmic adaptor subunit [Synechococcus sp. MIT S9501]|uniref:efflux RND transporter periplasmic adaptor subunit n=2 Tax=Synechococcus TaxID=1129 RepID=UPI0039B4971A
MRALAFTCLAVMASIPALNEGPVLAHAGHGDEFVQTGSVRQVKANPNRDQMLGIVSEKPKVETNGQLSVPNVAIVKANGQPYVFVFSGTTYDPVVIKPGSVSVDRTVVLDGVTADEKIVVSGALSIFAESQKNKR